MRAVCNTPCEASPLLCFWQLVWRCEVLTSQNQSVSYAFIYVYVSPTLAQSWAFSKDYDCKDNDNFWKLYQKEEKIIIIFSVIWQKMYLSASFWWKKRQINRKWGCKNLLCHNIPNVLDCFFTFFLLLKGQYPMHFSLLHRFHGTYFPSYCFSHLLLSYHPK